MVRPRFYHGRRVSKPPETSIAVEPHALTGVNGYDEFEIDVEAILRDQLPRFFRDLYTLVPAPLILISALL